MKRHRLHLAALSVLGLFAAWAVHAGPTPAAAAEIAPSRELAVCADPSNLPFSNQRQEGFENRIAGLIAADLHRTLRYTWNTQRRSFLRRTLLAGKCDLVIGVPAGLPLVAATRPYYTSTYVFVSARDRHLALHSFDDPVLRELRIGLQALGAEGANTPPAEALARRGITEHIVGYPMWGEYSDESPLARIVEAVARGEIDTAIVWGPFATYFARAHAEQLVVTPVEPDRLMPTLAFAYPMALGVRKGDDALLAELQEVLDRRRDDIDAILQDFSVPLVAMTPAVPVAALR